VIKPGTLVETLENELAVVISYCEHTGYDMYIVAMTNSVKWPHIYYLFYEHELRSLENEK
jgi:hypothetical protein